MKIIIITYAFLILIGVALAASGAAVTRCNSAADCSPSECCVSDITLDGRKRQVTSFGGSCRHLGHMSSDCLVNNKLSTTRRMYYDSCPCAEGFTCQGNGLFDIPLGETGSCVHS